MSIFNHESRKVVVLQSDGSDIGGVSVKRRDRFIMSCILLMAAVLFLFGVRVHRQKNTSQEKVGGRTSFQVKQLARGADELELVAEGIRYHSSLVKSGMGNFMIEQFDYSGVTEKPPSHQIEKVFFAFEANKVRIETTEENLRYRPPPGKGKEVIFSAFQKMAFNGQQATRLSLTVPTNGNAKHINSAGAIENVLDEKYLQVYDPRKWINGYQQSSIGKALFSSEIEYLNFHGLVSFNGEECYLIERESPEETVRIWINPQKDFQLQQIERHFRGITPDGVRVDNLGVTSYTYRKYTGGLWWLKSCTKRVFRKASSSRILTNEIRVQIAEDYQLNVDVPDSMFTIEFPEGISVYDHRLDVEYRWSRDRQIR